MDNTTYMCVWHLSLHTTLTYDTNRLCGLYIYICNLLSIFTGSCFACGISLPLCFIIAQIPKQKKTHGTQFFQIDAAGLFFPLCAVLCFWCMRVLCIHPGWEKIGLWIPLNDLFFQMRKFQNSKKAGRR